MSLEQIMDRVEEDVLAHADDLGVSGEAVIAAFVVPVGLAAVAVLGLAAGLGLAEHTPVTGIAVDEGTQGIDASGLWVAVGRRAGTGGAADAPDVLGGFVDLPGDQGFMGGALATSLCPCCRP